MSFDPSTAAPADAQFDPMTAVPLTGPSTRQILTATSIVTPDVAAEAARLGKVYNTPAQAVLGDIDTFRRQEQIDRTDAALSRTPVLADVVRQDPLKAPQVRDDLVPLSTLAEMVESFKRGLAATRRGSDVGNIVDSVEVLALISRIERGELPTDLEITKASPYGSMFVGVGKTPENLARMRQFHLQRISDNVVDFGRRTQEIEASPPSPELARFQQQTGLGEALSALGDAPVRITAQVVTESLGALLPALPIIAAGGIAGGPFGLAMTTGMSSASIEYLNALPDIFRELKVDINDIPGLQRAIGTPEFLEKNRQAMIKAGVIGVFDAATAGLAGVRLATRPAANVAAQVGVQMAGGGAGEAVGSIASGQEVSAAAVLSEMIGEVPGAMIDLGTLALRRASERAGQAQEATTGAETLQTALQAAAQSKLRERSPEEFRAVLEQMASTEDGRVTEIYVDGEVLNQLPIEVRSLLPQAVQDQIPQAAGIGDVVAIPVADALTVAPGTPLEQVLVENARLRPDAMTQAEARAAGDQAAQYLQQEAQRVIEQAADQEAMRASAEVVRTSILSELNAAGRYRPQVNEAMSQWAGAFYTTMASRVGMTPEEFYQRYRLRVLGEAQPGQGPVIEQGRELDRNGIPVATMAEVQAVADIPTVEKMAQAMDLLGEAEFERRVQARMRSLGATTPEQQAMVTESVAINAVAIDRADAARGETLQQAAVERLQMVAERGVRATATRTMISAEERAAIEASAQATNLTIEEIEEAVRRSKLAHPVAQGWEPLVYVRTTVEVVDGETKVTHEYRKSPYTFSTSADGKQLEPGTAGYTRRANAVAKSMVDEVRRVFKRAADGDRNAQNILAQAGWYKAMRKRLRQEFGGLGDLFADLLGATSPNTPVRDNWFNAVDALRRASRGDFDALIPQWEAWSDRVDALEADLRGWFNEQLVNGLSKAAIKRLPEYQAKLGVLREARVLPDALLPKKESGAKYGFNGRNVVRAMVDLWRIVKNADPDIARGGTAPKALNFSGNLIGFRSRATIDVWAARMLQRLSGGRRIASMAETGVSGEMREDATTTLQFGFGQDVFSRASASIRNDAELNTDPVLAEINDDDLQAVVWFIEKEVWTVNDWTSAAGEGGSFELEANLTGTSRQDKVKELRRIIDASPPTADLVTAGQDTTAALRAIEDHERQHAAEIEELRKLVDGEIQPYRGSKKRMEELGKIARPPVEATRLLGNVERAKARLEDFARRKVAAKAELAALEREVDRFVGGLSIQMSQDTQGIDFVPTDADMAILAATIRRGIYERDGGTVLGSKALSTEGRYGGVERSLDLEVVAREGYNPNALWREMLRQAQAARQDSTFLSRVLRANEQYDPLTHRPGVEIYFRSAASQAQLEKVLADLAKEGVEFLTVIVDGRRLADTMGGAMPAAVGVRLQYVPEFEQRYGMDDLSGLDDAALAAKIEEKAAELRAIADRVSDAVEGVSFAGQFWYETQVAFSSQYQEKIDALATGVTEEGAAGTPGGQQWAGDSVRAGLEGADRQSRETAGGEPGADVLGGDAQRAAVDERGGRSDTLAQQPIGDRARRYSGGSLAPLEGAPNVANASGPDPRLVAVAEQYARDNGIPLRRQAEYVQVDPERAARIAAAYDAMVHAPQDPAVREAYENLIRQTRAQYDALVAAGYSFTFFDSQTDPYQGNPWNAMRDLRANQRMAVYGTYDGYGTEGVTQGAVDDNPMLVDTGLQWPDQQGVMRPVTANDLFRAVHDAFGHGLEGAGFRAQGEENAWQAHVRLFTGSARAAITSETRGQNSWLNYGPYGERNQNAKVEDTVFADQKVGLMPEWTWSEGRAKDEPVFVELDSQRDAEAFRDAVDRVKRGRPYSFPLHVHDVETYRNARLFLSEDGQSGFALIGDEIASFFSGGGGQAYPTLRLAVAQGGRRIDAYRTRMPSVLGRAGFRPVARVEFNPEFATEIWDYEKFRRFQDGRPDLVFFAYDPSFKGDGDVETAGTPLVDYERALELQAQAVREPIAQPPLAQGPRGTFNPRTLELVLSPTADLSTFFHETGHFFLEVMADVASQPDAPAMIQEDMAKILAWFGVPDLATWNSMTLDQQRPYHERWAESIEQYLMEGKAPSVELQPLMRRFRAWLTNVYRSIQQFLAGRPDAAQQPLNDDIRRVFDRMLATDEQIAQANEVAGFMPDEQADGEAAERLQKRSMADLKWAVKARDKVIAKLKREARDIEKQVRAEVTAEVEQRPEVLAKAAIDKAEKDFEADPVSADMNIAAIADAFDYPSVDAMYQAIEAFGNKREVIDGLTEQRMLEQYGDLTDERAIQEAANEAVHNEARARSLATELRTQQEMLGRRRDTGETTASGARRTINVLVEAAKQFGANVIARTSLKDLRATAWKHTSAERRAGKRWQEATMKGDTAEAVKAKQDQVLNNAAAKAALDATAEAKKILEFFGRVTKGNDEKVVEKGRDPDIVNAARAVLAAYGVQTPASKNAAAYMEAVKRNDPETYAALEPMIAAAMANAQPLEALTFEELQGLNESIRAFWFMAKRSRQMEVDGNLLDIDDVAQELYLRMEQIGIPNRVPGEGMAVTKAEERGLFLKQGIAFLRRVEAWAEGMDGKYGGPFLRYVFQPIKDAADAYRKDRIAYRKRFQGLVDNLAPIVGDSVIAAPELGYTFGTPGSTAGTAMNEILHAIAHTGNDSNKRKLLLGRGWATENPDGTLDTGRWDAFIQRLVAEGKLTQGHFDFVQGVWDLLEDTKPLAQKAHRDAFGRYFSEVTANEFVDPFGVTRRGGYLPAQVDTRLVKDNLLRKMAEEQNNSMAYSFPQPAKGFTISRTEYNQPLMLDLRSLSQHIDKVLLFGHMTNPARDVRKLITRKTVSQPLDRLQPATLESMLQPWLQRSSQQIVETPIVGTGRWARIPGIIRARAGMALMFANVSNAIQQITGLANAAVRVKPSFLMRSLAQYVANPREFSRAVWSASPYMDDRAKNEVSVLNEQMEAILIKPSTYETVKDWSSRHAYFLQTALDNVLSPIVWTGAFNQALAEGMSDADAVRFADSSVRQTQGSTLPEDVSRIETGPAYARAFTQFVGYFNMMANTNATALKQIVGEVGLKRGAGKALYVVMMGLMVPIWAAEAIAIAMRGGPEDEDDDGYLDDWLAEVFGMGTLKGMLAQIPIAGQFGVAAIQRFNDNPLDDRVSLSPAVSLLESAVGAPQSVYKAIVDEGSAQKAIRDVATLVSVATGVPLYGVARPIGYAAGVAQGKIEPEGPIDVARGLITGTASPESKQR